MKDDGKRRPGRRKTPANDNGAGPEGDAPRQRLDRVVLDIARLIGRQMAHDDFERLRAANDNRRARGDETDKD